MINALSRFGTISFLRYTRSADNDGNIATFTFKGSHYTSRFIDFVAIEHQDRTGQVLERLNDQQAQLLATLGGNSYPFVDIAGTYANDAPNSYPGGYDVNLLVD